MQSGILERRGRKQEKFRCKWTSSKGLQSQLAALSSKRLSESRDLSESEPSIQTDVNFEKGQVQIVSSWAPSPDKRVPPWGSRAAESSGSLRTDLSLPGSPGFFTQLLGHDQPSLGLFISLSRDIFSFFRELCKAVFQERMRVSVTQWCLRNREDKLGDPRGTSFLNSSEISNALPYL